MKTRDLGDQFLQHTGSSLTDLGTAHVKRQVQEEIDEILSRYPVRRSALIPLLYLAHRTGLRHRSSDDGNRRPVEVDPPQVYETATFYTMLNLKHVGKFHIQVCKSLMCALVGSDTVVGLGQDANSESVRAKRRPTDSSPSARSNVWPPAAPGR